MKTLRNLSLIGALFLMAFDAQSLTITFIMGALIVALLLIAVYTNHKTEKTNDSHR
jgi:L-asparagine transporter-like permease